MDFFWKPEKRGRAGNLPNTWDGMTNASAFRLSWKAQAAMWEPPRPGEDELAVRACLEAARQPGTWKFRVVWVPPHRETDTLTDLPFLAEKLQLGLAACCVGKSKSSHQRRGRTQPLTLPKHGHKLNLIRERGRSNSIHGFFLANGNAQCQVSGSCRPAARPAVLALFSSSQAVLVQDDYLPCYSETFRFSRTA
jgi:hypothetical protein